MAKTTAEKLQVLDDQEATLLAEIHHQRKQAAAGKVSASYAMNVQCELAKKLLAVQKKIKKLRVSKFNE
jgi:hypothetical protein